MQDSEKDKERKSALRKGEEWIRICTRDREHRRNTAGAVWGTEIEWMRWDEEVRVKGMRYAGAREYVTGMARGQLTFIILTLMDYLIPYIPTDPSLAFLLPPLRLQTPFSVLGEVQDNIHGCIRANARRRPLK